MNARNFKRRHIREAQKKLLAHFDALPKPPKNADGSCSCGCRAVIDKGPCPDYFEDRATGRCRLCDHDIKCHRRRGEAPPADYNTPLDFVRLAIVKPGLLERVRRFVRKENAK